MRKLEILRARLNEELETAARDRDMFRGDFQNGEKSALNFAIAQIDILLGNEFEFELDDAGKAWRQLLIDEGLIEQSTDIEL